MQSPFQKNRAPRTKKETKFKSFIKMGISKLMETVVHKEHNLFSSASAARTAALPQTLTFWLSPERDASGSLGQGTQKGRSCQLRPLLQEAQENFSVVQVCKGSGTMTLQWMGMFLRYGLAFNNVKEQKVLTDTQQTPERLITQPVSAPLPAPLEHLQRVFKFDLQMLIVFLCST